MQASSRETEVANHCYYVMECRWRGDVKGQVFLDYGEAEAAYNACPRRHASMLTDDDFTELKFMGWRESFWRAPIKKFRSWWEIRKAWIS